MSTSRATERSAQLRNVDCDRPSGAEHELFTLKGGQLVAKPLEHFSIVLEDCLWLFVFIPAFYLFK